jgi:hypothetical protein
MRKIVQIAISDVYVYALCDDGALWATTAGIRDVKWTRVTDIPQEKPPEPANDLFPLEHEPTGYRETLGLYEKGE